VDKILELAWRIGRPPLNGRTIYLEEAVPIADLLPVIRCVVAFLEDRYPNAALRRLDDWHEHDGVILEGSKTDWPSVKALLSSVEVFRAGVSDDTHVRLGLYDDDLSFYLRFGYFESPGQVAVPPETGIMDLSSSDSIIQDVIALLQPRRTMTASANVYFHERYKGRSGH
jgi:hypothetical protein